MNENEYDRMYQLEDNYWWYVARRQLVLDLTAELPNKHDRLILDIGCGTGATASALVEYGRVAGLDFSPLALSACAQRGLNQLIRAKAETIPMPDDQVDLIVATDIIEHLDDDLVALQEFHRVLRPGGYAIITVPAFQFLWSEHDIALMHRRRYISQQLRERSQQAGFQVVQLNYALFFLFPLSLSRLLRRRVTKGQAPQAQINPVPNWINKSLIRFQRFEFRLSRWVRFPWGLSVMTLLRKNSIPEPIDGKLEQTGTKRNHKLHT